MRVLLAVSLIAMSLAGCINPEGPVDRTPDEVAPEAQAEDGSWNLEYYGAGNDPFFGDADASVQVIAYDAPACINCKRYHDTVLPTIMADYVETGKIGYHALQWRVGYPYDIDGGIAEECAFREGGSDVYADMVSRVFANAAEPNSQRTGNLPGILRELADDHDLDGDVLVSCYENEETRDEVDADIAGGKSSGAGTNPGFAVLGPNGYFEHIRGSQGPGEAIERALAA